MGLEGAPREIPLAKSLRIAMTPDGSMYRINFYGHKFGCIQQVQRRVLSFSYLQGQACDCAVHTDDAVL
jgi:hypothetical protein